MNHHGDDRRTTSAVSPDATRSSAADAQANQDVNLARVDALVSQTRSRIGRARGRRDELDACRERGTATR